MPADASSFSSATLARVPAALFGAVLGLGGLAGGWRVASRLWGMPWFVGEVLAAAAVVAWLAVATHWGAKWLWAREAAVAELADPVRSGFAAMAPAATMIAGLAVQPFVHPLGFVMLFCGVIGQIAFAVWFVGRLWQGGRAVDATTPILQLPTSIGSFVAAMALAALNLHDAAMMAFGAGFVSWLVLEAVTWQRLMYRPALAPALRASMGIHMAPPAVGLTAYTAASGSGPDGLALMMFGCALLQAAVTLRLLPWLLEQPLGPPWWSFGFGAAVLPTGAMRLAAYQGAETAALLAPPLFVAANLVVAALIAMSVKRLVTGRYLPPAG